LKFPYCHFVDKNNPNIVIAKPMIEIRLSHGNKGMNLLALIDSGADACLFHKSVADALEIDYKQGQPKDFSGISGRQAKIVAYFHQVHLTVLRLGSIDLSVGFTDSDGVGALLGQLGFFDGFDIAFVRAADFIDIKPHS
jgi:Aspartyl protease